MEKTEDERSDSRPRRFQYSVRALFGLTTAVAIACAIFFALPTWVSGLTTFCVIVSIPGLLTILVVYGRGSTRAFGIGALFPAGVCLIPAFSYPGLEVVGEILGDILGEARNSPEARIGFLIFLNVYFAIVLGNGSLAVCMRRWLESGQRLMVPPPAGDQQPQPADAEADPDRTGSEEP